MIMISNVQKTSLSMSKHGQKRGWDKTKPQIRKSVDFWKSNQKSTDFFVKNKNPLSNMLK